MVEHIDNSWTLSYVKSWWATGERADVVFGNPFGGGGSTAFGFVFVVIYGAFLNIVGWTRGYAVIVSSVLVFVSAFLWMRILKKLNYHEVIYKWFPLALLLLEGSFAASNMARPDAMGFFFATAALFFVVHQYNLLAGLLFVMACETHPYAGALSGTYITAYAIYLAPEIINDFGKYHKLLGRKRPSFEKP